VVFDLDVAVLSVVRVVAAAAAAAVAAAVRFHKLSLYLLYGRSLQGGCWWGRQSRGSLGGGLEGEARRQQRLLEVLFLLLLVLLLLLLWKMKLQASKLEVDW